MPVLVLRMSEENFERADPDTNVSSNTINRRGYLKLTGVVAASATGAAYGSSSAQAASYGYGEGGYGEGSYGGGGFSVTTTSPTNIGTSSATLTGELSDLNGVDAGDCYFEWRQTGASEWNTTAKQTLTATGSFSTDLGTLSESTEYEYRANADASDDDADSGSTVSFSTDSSSTSEPVIDRFSVSEAGRPNPHTNITVVWDVSDADGDLASVDIDISESSETVSGVTWSLSGATASDTDSFEIKQSDGQTFDVTLTVTDSSGNSESASTSVTE